METLSKTSTVSLEEALKAIKEEYCSKEHYEQESEQYLYNTMHTVETGEVKGDITVEIHGNVSFDFDNDYKCYFSNVPDTEIWVDDETSYKVKGWVIEELLND